MKQEIAQRNAILQILRNAKLTFCFNWLFLFQEKSQVEIFLEVQTEKHNDAEKKPHCVKKQGIQ